MRHHASPSFTVPDHTKMEEQQRPHLTPVGDIAKAALEYAAKGWPVLPVHSRAPNGTCTGLSPDCKEPAKHALTPNAENDATTDPEIIAGWWQRWPWANVGVVTGARSGIVVFHVDDKPDALEAYDRLLDEVGLLPITLTGLSGGDGFQIVFRPRSASWAALNPRHALAETTNAFPGKDNRGCDTVRVPHRKGTCLVVTVAPRRPTIEFRADDPTLTPNGGLALVAETCRVLDVIGTIERHVGPIKARRRGAGAGELLVGLAECMLAGGDFFTDLDPMRADVAGEHALGQPDQQLTRAGPPAARLDRTDVPLDGVDDVEHPAGLGYQRQPTVRRQRRVIGAELDSRPAGRYGDHQTGAFPVRDSDGVATPIVLARKGICRLCERVSWIQRGLTRRSRSDAKGPRASHGPEMGPAVCGALVEGPDADARWDHGRPGEGDPARGSDLPVDRQHLPTSWLRRLDDPGISGCPVREVCRRCGGPLRDRTPGPPGAGGGRSSARRDRVETASRQDADRLLQGWNAAPGVRAGVVHVLWVRVPFPEG